MDYNPSDFQMNEYRLDHRFDDLEVSAKGAVIYFAGTATMAIGAECGARAVIRIDNLELDSYTIKGAKLCVDIEGEGLSEKVDKARNMIERLALAQFKKQYSDGLIEDGNW